MGTISTDYRPFNAIALKVNAFISSTNDESTAVLRAKFKNTAGENTLDMALVGINGGNASTRAVWSGGKHSKYSVGFARLVKVANKMEHDNISYLTKK